ncbi:MAG TPA: CBS domain-containing protein [Pirellulaceae bacterium]|jgi:CBS domain-containing protein|nr:CBS domain-containing protein [Pirellulaceae bacterium]
MTGSLAARDIMTRKLITLTPEMDVFEAIELLLSHRISGAPVVDREGRFLGVFSEKCSMGALLDGCYDGLPSHELRCFYDPAPLTVEEDTELLTLAQIFQSTAYRRLPVLRDGQLVGQVSRRDVMAAAMSLIKPALAVVESQTLYLSAVRTSNDLSW